LSFFDKVFESKGSEEIDIEDFLNNLDVEEETMYEDADAYVKPIALQRDEDVSVVVDEAKSGNIVLLNKGENLAFRQDLLSHFFFFRGLRFIH
jgi:SepF-like predicted cell division protein (DUF552 family)